MNSKLYLLVGILMTAASSQANLIVNGDFEVPLTADASSTSFIVVPTGNTTLIGGWISGGRAGDVSVDIVSQTGNPSFPANTGDQFIDLAGTPGPGSIFQDVTTTPGQVYALSFAASSNTANQTMKVYVDGVVIDVFTGPNQGTWLVKNYMVTATMSTTRFMFGSDDANQTQQGPLIDTVSLNAVPEPTTLTVLGLGALALLRRRRS